MDRHQAIELLPAMRLPSLIVAALLAVATAARALAASDPPVVRFSHQFQSLEVSLGDLVFSVGAQRVDKAPAVRSWFFYRSVQGSIEGIASGSFAVGDLRVRSDQIAFAVPGYNASCLLTERTQQLTNAVPHQRQTLQPYDGSPTLFFESSERTTDYLKLECTLQTPDMGTLVDGVGFYEKGFVRQRYNDRP